uniref:Amine oxidase n=1 Tax=Cyanothece sp. (strain PCC 7425 / ATCC 29141) TaxID=395961 RepID=B8HK25_CYAP4
MHYFPVVIVGAGPAGLTAAYELVKQGICPLVLEQSDRPGGISRTETYKGYRFDIGGHRFYTKVTEVEQLWQEVLGPDLIRVPRLSRIYYQGKYFNYPLELSNTLLRLGFLESLLITISYLKIKVNPIPEEQNLEEWVINRFGERLFQTFFKTYTEKVWGIPCDKIQADWAAQRIKGLSIKQAVLNALFGTKHLKTLIKEFQYPRLGPGMMWERFQQEVEQRGGQVWLNSPVTQIKAYGSRIKSVTIAARGEVQEIVTDHLISSMPVTHLIRQLTPPPPPAVVVAAQGLHYRAFLIVALIIDREHMFADNWLYIHSPEVKVGRIQNFKNWSPEMVPDSTKTCLGMEYFCSEGDAIWTLPNSALIDLATQELEQLDLAKGTEVSDGVVIRQPKAYPVYDATYRQHLQVIQSYLAEFTNLQTVGRNGMHRYNNQDHSMLTGMLAVRNLLGENHNLWEVNTERSYYEEFTVDKSPSSPATPAPS